MDSELYNFVKSQFDALTTWLGSDFKEELAAFKILNQNCAPFIGSLDNPESFADAERHLIKITMNSLQGGGQEKEFACVSQYAAKRYPDWKEFSEVNISLPERPAPVISDLSSEKNKRSGKIAQILAQNERTPDSPIIYIHLMKTGGSTLRTVLEREYGLDAVFTLYEKGQQQDICIDRYWEMSIENREKKRVFAGHLHFGLHEKLEGPYNYLTMLRDPVERIISLYHYIRSMPNHGHHKRIVGENMSMSDFVESEMSSTLGKLYIQFISGIRTLSYWEYSEEALNATKLRLQEFFPIVGILEKLDESLLLMKRAYGWKTPYYVKENTTKNKPEVTHTDKDMEIIRKVSRMDRELYAHVDNMLEATINEQGADFYDDLEAFRILNRFDEPHFKFLYQPGIFAEVEQHLIQLVLSDLSQKGKLVEMDIVTNYARKEYPEWKELQRVSIVSPQKHPVTPLSTLKGESETFQPEVVIVR